MMSVLLLPIHLNFVVSVLMDIALKLCSSEDFLCLSL